MAVSVLPFKSLDGATSTGANITAIVQNGGSPALTVVIVVGGE